MRAHNEAGIGVIRFRLNDMINHEHAESTGLLWRQRQAEVPKGDRPKQ